MVELFLAARRAAFALSLLVLASAPAAAQQAMMLPVDPAPLTVSTVRGNVTFWVEIADEEGERQRGLMFRLGMPDDRGMLFVFPETREAGFWMENTPQPLDLVFIGEDGRVHAVRQGVPFSRATIPSLGPVRFVLELLRGTAQKTGIDVGDRVRHPAIDAVAGSN